MPELPEVETVANDLRQLGLVGSRISAVLIHWHRTIAFPVPQEMIERIIGQTIVSIARRAKYLVLQLSSGDILYVHLRMTGRFAMAALDAPVGPHERVTLELDNSRRLQFHDTRKFGKWYLAKEADEVTKALGPEPMDEAFTEQDFAHRLLAKGRQLKPLLLDQTFLAGLGNIYVDEALWYAKLHPQAIASSLTKKQAYSLLKAIRHVLQRGLDKEGTTLGSGKSNFYRPGGTKGAHQDVLYVFRRTGQPCTRCGTSIVRLVVAQRSTHICPNCQP